MTSRKKRRDDTKGAGYLPGWYACMSNGFQALCAERDAKRDLMVAMLSEPERAKTQIIEMPSAAPLPSPTAASSTS